jgi:hypothetical protein
MFLEFDGNVITNILILKMPFKQERFLGEHCDNLMVIKKN